MKIAGAILFILMTSLYGFRSAMELKERRLELIYLGQVMNQLKSQITYRRRRVGEAFGYIAKECRKPYQETLLHIYECLEESSESWEIIWEETLQELTEITCLKKDDVKIFAGLSSLSGATDYQLQMDIFEQIQKGLEEQILFLKREFEQKGKMYCCMGISIGILGVIVLI